MACFLGWTLDAFDYFLLTYCLSAVAAEFHTGVKQVAEGLFWTLAMRPVGALLFGLLAERIGRRPALMLNVVSFSVFELLSAFAPTLPLFLVTRALFGVAMGGEWGVGAALTFETLPAVGRGFFSGLLQEGYVVGSLLAAAAYAFIFPHLPAVSLAGVHLPGVPALTSWRVLFLLGALPSLLVLYIRRGVKESPAWLARRATAVKREGAVKKESASAGWRSLRGYVLALLSLLLLMTAFTSFSHGTQDLYPTFLERSRHLPAAITGRVAIVAGLGALAGGMCFGALSERWGRRRAIVVAALLAVPMIPLWLWSRGAVGLAVGGFLMQFMVQGAWGVIPAHLNELSPPAVRAVLPGLAYQLGNLLSSRNSVFQVALADRYARGDLQPVLAVTVVVVALAVAVLTAVGRESRGGDLSHSV